MEMFDRPNEFIVTNHLQETVKCFQEALGVDLQMDWTINSDREWENCCGYRKHFDSGVMLSCLESKELFIDLQLGRNFADSMGAEGNDRGASDAVKICKQLLAADASS